MPVTWHNGHAKSSLSINWARHKRAEAKQEKVVILNQISVYENCRYIISSSLFQEKTVDLFHCRPTVGFERPTTPHEVP